MKIIVFGGNGFVGQWLLKALIEVQTEVLSCDLGETGLQKDIPYMQADIRNKASLGKIPFDSDDIVINLAANQYHNKVPRKNRKAFFFDTNTTGAENIMEAAYKAGCRKLIQFTTDMTYGKPQYLPVDTVHPQNPFGPYGQSKAETEKLCKYYRTLGMDITVFRPRMIIGPGRLGILKKLFWLIDRSLPVPTIGNGKNCYQMISVFDCVSAIQCAIRCGIPNEEYNLGSENPPSVHELLTGLIQDVGSHSIVVPTPGRLVKATLSLMGTMGLEIMYKEQYMIADENYILDIAKTARQLDWRPRYKDSDMIVQAYQEFCR